LSHAGALRAHGLFRSWPDPNFDRTTRVRLVLSVCPECPVGVSTVGRRRGVAVCVLVAARRQSRRSRNGRSVNYACSRRDPPAQRDAGTTAQAKSRRSAVERDKSKKKRPSLSARSAVPSAFSGIATRVSSGVSAFVCFAPTACGVVFYASPSSRGTFGRVAEVLPSFSAERRVLHRRGRPDEPTGFRVADDCRAPVYRMIDRVVAKHGGVTRVDVTREMKLCSADLCGGRGAPSK